MVYRQRGHCCVQICELEELLDIFGERMLIAQTGGVLMALLMGMNCNAAAS